MEDYARIKEEYDYLLWSDIYGYVNSKKQYANDIYSVSFT